MAPPFHALVGLLVARLFAGEMGVPLGLAWLIGALLPALDYLARIRGIEVFHRLHRGPFHSVLICVPLAAVLGGTLHFAWAGAPVVWLVLAAAGGAALHLVLDCLSSGGAEVLWPVRPTRYSLDLMPPQDPYFLGILAGGLLPGVVSTGAGRWGAAYGILAAALFLLYRSFAYLRMSRLLTTLDIPGETVARRAVFPLPRSPNRWLCVVETEANLHRLWANLLDADLGAGEIETFTLLAPNRYVEAAQTASAAQAFLRQARFPLLRYIHKDAVWEVSWHEMGGARASTRAARNWRAAVEVNDALHVVTERVDLS